MNGNPWSVQFQAPLPSWVAMGWPTSCMMRLKGSVAPKTSKLHALVSGKATLWAITSLSHHLIASDSNLTLGMRCLHNGREKKWLKRLCTKHQTNYSSVEAELLNHHGNAVYYCAVLLQSTVNWVEKVISHGLRPVGCVVHACQISGLHWIDGRHLQQ